MQPASTEIAMDHGSSRQRATQTYQSTSRERARTYTKGRADKQASGGPATVCTSTSTLHTLSVLVALRGAIICVCAGAWCLTTPDLSSQLRSPAAAPMPTLRRGRVANQRALIREVQLVAPSPRSERVPPAPPIVPRLLPRLEERIPQAAEYSLRHYGDREWRLDPQVIVLHYTCGPSFSSAWHTFANNRPRRGELPGLSAHYIVDQDGTIYGIVPPSIRCRHANGINHVAIGIEFVQRCLREGPAAVERAMLDRGPQIEAALALVRHLRARFRIRDEDIIGHAMVNRHRLFTDLLGRSNDHGDWREGAVREFRRRL